MQKLTAIQHTDKVLRSVIDRADLNEFDLRMAIARVVKSDTMELRAQYVKELIHAIVDAEKANAS
jgi:hypothetical protein